MSGRSRKKKKEKKSVISFYVLFWLFPNRINPIVMKSDECSEKERGRGERKRREGKEGETPPFLGDFSLFPTFINPLPTSISLSL